MKIKSIAFAALALTAVTASGQKTWTLEECVDYAMQHNITLKKNAQAEALSTVEVDRAKGALLPSLSASVVQGLTYRPFQETGGSMVNGGIASNAADKATQTGQYGVNASWTVWDGGQNKYNIQNAEMNRESAALTTQQTANSIEEQIAQLYVQTIYTREALKTYRQLLAADSTIYERAQTMCQNGKLSRADVVRLKSQVSSARYDVVNAQSQIDLCKMQLRQLLELDYNEDFEIADLPVSDEVASGLIPALTDAYLAALGQRPEIAQSELAVDQSRLATKIARTGYLPSISLTGGVGDSHLTGTSQNFFNQMKNNFNANLGLSVSIPIFDKRQTKSEVEKARVQEVVSDLDLLDAQKTLYKTIEGFWQSATTSRQKYLASVENVESAEASYELLTEQFNVGVKNIADLLTGRSTLLTAKQNLLQDKYTAVLNRAMLDFYATGEFRALQ